MDNIRSTIPGNVFLYLSCLLHFSLQYLFTFSSLFSLSFLYMYLFPPFSLTIPLSSSLSSTSPPSLPSLPSLPPSLPLSGVTLSSDFIAGFCEEEEEDHKDTLSLLNTVQYDMAYLYAYSMRKVSVQ